MIRVCLECAYTPHHEIVVAHRVYVFDAAIDPRHRSVDDRRSTWRGVPLDSLEALGFVVALGKLPAQVALAVAQNIYAEASAARHCLPGRRVDLGEKADKRWIERDGGERADGEAHGLVTVHTCDDRDARREVAEHRAEMARVERAGIRCRRIAHRGRLYAPQP